MKKAKELGVDATILSISKPYDVANYPDADGVVAVYGAKGMDPTEGLRPDNAFGPNIPAGIEIILDNGNAHGTLPVDIPLINENHEMTDEIAYKFGLVSHSMNPQNQSHLVYLRLPTSKIHLMWL